MRGVGASLLNTASKRSKLSGRSTFGYCGNSVSFEPHLLQKSAHNPSKKACESLVLLSNSRRKERRLVPPNYYSTLRGTARAKMAGSREDAVDLTGDSDDTASATTDDYDLHRAIALSLQSDPVATERASSPLTIISAESKSSAEPTFPVGGILGMNRKKQEEERLARLKRKRGGSVSPPPLRRGTKALDDNGVAGLTDGNETGTKSPARSEKQISNSSTSAASSNLRYPEGVVKKTWAFGFARENDIKVEEVIQPKLLEAAMLSSFQWDWDWLLPKMDLQRTKFVLAMQAKDDETKQGYQRDFEGVPNVRLCFPNMEGQISCMHSKLMLLFYPTYLRIAIPTANLTPYDWGEPFRDLMGGVMENTVFLIDLPKRETANKCDENAEIPFFKSLLYFLQAMGLPADVPKKIHEFDFSKTAQYGFVHSIGGPHYGDSWRKTGICGLGQYLHDTGLRTFKSIEIDFVTSSVGSLDDDFLRTLYLAGQGDNGLSEYMWRTAKSTPPGIVQDLKRRLGEDFASGWKQHFRFYYPSDRTVRASKGGPGYAGTICFHSKWWNGPKFPRSLMRDCESRRNGLLMHNKVSWNRDFRRLSVAHNVGIDLVYTLHRSSGNRRWARGPRLGVCRECKPVRKCMVSCSIFSYAITTSQELIHLDAGEDWSETERA
jgi:Tyrosyl-DNA phosphodiesterase